MAASLVGGALLSAFLQVLFDRLASSEVVDFFKSRKHRTTILLEKLNTTIVSVNAVLDDAEEKQVTKPSVKNWVDELKDTLYVADDLLDEVAYMVLKDKMGNGSEPLFVKVKSFFDSRRYIFRKTGTLEFMLGNVLDRLEYLVGQMGTLGLKQGTGESPGVVRVPSTSLVDELGVYGRDGDRKELIGLLGSRDVELGVVPIVGMGGVGKTTLAQLVYNDLRVKEWFDVRIWVCVSEEFDVFKVTRSVLKELGLGSCDWKTLNQLQVELQEVLKGKRFLLVLDDVWNENYTFWDDFRKPLKSGAPGSWIVVTSRHESVASVMGTVQAHELKELNDDDCWLLFEAHAFGKGSSSTNPELMKIGREIVSKCRGLPLAAKTLGGLLRSKRNVEEWRKILKSSWWDLKSGDILPALRLSYHYLPSHLKRCFAYCAVFPKDYEFEKEELVLLWMAEGYLNQINGNKQVLEIGDEYFNDLVSRSFFQRSSSQRSCFVMHDLMNDLAKSVSGEFCSRLDGDGDDSCKITKRTRHLSYARTEPVASNYMEGMHKANHLRTFLLVEWSHITDELMQDLLTKLTRLRVLSLPQYRSIAELPGSIGGLKHLRYLNLSTASIRMLPETVGSLYNLQTLILHECVYLSVLPESIGNLKQLQHLDLFGSAITRLPQSVSRLLNLQTLILCQCKDLVRLPTNLGRLINLHHLDVRGTKLQEMPPEMCKLKNLKTLTDFVLNKESGSCIKELGELKGLHGKLCISNLQDVVNVEDVVGADLRFKDLNELELRWNGDIIGTQHETVLELLEPCTTMECLFIVGYGGRRFPPWVGDSSFSKMVSLKLIGCQNCSSLPPLGQLESLKDLLISDFGELVTIGPEFYGFCSSDKKPFRSLKTLKIERMPKWCTWAVYERKEGGEAFPLLQELYITDCPNFENALPSHLQSLATLEIEGCPNLTDALPNGPVILKMKIKDDSRHALLAKQPSGQYSLVIDRFYSFDALLDGSEKMSSVLSNLEEIEIRNHDSLTCFPLELFPKLKFLRLTKCPNLKSLSAREAAEKDMKSPYSREFLSAGEATQKDLTSLYSLEIRECPELVSFPEEGLPAPNLTRLLLLGCSNVEAFPGKMKLPSTLTTLKIWDFLKLRSLEFKGLQHLAFLRELEICNCPNLQSLPDEGLPTSLLSLSIFLCGLLEQRCQRETGEDWHKISRIPHVNVSFHNVKLI